jgi:hypothetical protein
MSYILTFVESPSAEHDGRGERSEDGRRKHLAAARPGLQHILPRASGSPPAFFWADEGAEPVQMAYVAHLDRELRLRAIRAGRIAPTAG